MIMTMRHQRRWAFGAGLLLLSACHGLTNSQTSATLVRVNGEAITDADLNAFVQTAPPAARARLAAPGGKKQFVDVLIDRALLYRAGDAAKLARNPVVQQQIAAAEESIVADAYLRQKLEEKARAYFAAHPEEFTTVELSQILIKSDGAAPTNMVPSHDGKTANGAQNPAEVKSASPRNAAKNSATGSSLSDDAALKLANELKSRIANGEAFADLAKHYSDDIVSKESGGKLGSVWRHEPRLMRRGMDAVLDLAFTLAQDTVGGPIKTENGYHLVMVHGAPTPRAFDDVKEQLLFRVQSDTRREVMQSLRKDAKIEWIDPSLTNPTTTNVPLSDAPPPTQH